MTELEYVKTGDYLIPNLKLTQSETESEPLGKYGLMRYRYLREYNKYLYTLLEIRGELDSHLREIDEAAVSRVERFMAESLKKEPIPEDLKNSNPLEWMGRMENLKAQAEEIVMTELIFA